MFIIVLGLEVFIDYNLNVFMGMKVVFIVGIVDVVIDGMEIIIIFMVIVDGKILSGEWKGILEDI